MFLIQQSFFSQYNGSNASPFQLLNSTSLFRLYLSRATVVTELSRWWGGAARTFASPELCFHYQQQTGLIQENSTDVVS